MQSIRYFFYISFFLALVYFRLYLFQLSEDLPLIIFGGEYIPLQVLNLLYLFLEYFLLGPEFRFVGPEYLHGMRLNFGRIGYAVFEHEELPVDEFDLVFDLFDFSVHELINVFEASDLFVLFSAFGLGLYLKAVLLLENQIDFDCPSLLRQRLLIHLNPFLHFLVLHPDLLARIIGLRHDGKGGLGLVTSLEPQLLQLPLHRLYRLHQSFFLADFAHHKGERIMQPSIDTTVLLLFIRKDQVDFVVIGLLVGRSSSQHLQFYRSHDTDAPLLGRLRDCHQKIVRKLFEGHRLLLVGGLGDGLFDHFLREGEFPIEAGFLDAHPKSFVGVGESELVGGGILEDLIGGNRALFEQVGHSYSDNLNFEYNSITEAGGLRRVTLILLIGCICLQECLLQWLQLKLFPNDDGYNKLIMHKSHENKVKKPSRKEVETSKSRLPPPKQKQQYETSSNTYVITVNGQTSHEQEHHPHDLPRPRSHKKIRFTEDIEKSQQLHNAKSLGQKKQLTLKCSTLNNIQDLNVYSKAKSQKKDGRIGVRDRREDKIRENPRSSHSNGHLKIRGIKSHSKSHRQLNSKTFRLKSTEKTSSCQKSPQNISLLNEASTEVKDKSKSQFDQPELVDIENSYQFETQHQEDDFWWKESRALEGNYRGTKNPSKQAEVKKKKKSMYLFESNAQEWKEPTFRLNGLESTRDLLN